MEDYSSAMQPEPRALALFLSPAKQNDNATEDPNVLFVIISSPENTIPNHIIRQKAAWFLYR